MTAYIVTVTEKAQAAGERASQYEIEAKNKKEAVSKARQQVGWRSRHDSPLIYRAEAY